MAYRKQKLFAALLTSVVLHFILLCAYIRVRSTPHELLPIVVEYSPPVATVVKKQSSVQARTRSFSLSQFKPRGLFSQAVPRGSVSGSQEWSQPESYSLNAMTAYNGLTMEQANFIRALWNVINRSIDDSAFLSEYGHFGQIYFYFEIDEQGRLDIQSLRASGADQVLKVLSVRAVRRALQNQDGELHFLPRRMQLSARFSWSNYQNCESLRGIQKNYLSFCHYAEDKRKSFSKAEKTMTYISALQYGFGAAEEIEKYRREQMRRTGQFDPFEELRRDPAWNLGD